MVNEILSSTPAPPLAAPRDEDALRKSARDLEASFLAEMLKHAGFDKALSSQAGFGGEAFSSFLVTALAERLAASGGVGFADKIYAQLKDKPA